jgi:predicted transcriptional regulator
VPGPVDSKTVADKTLAELTTAIVAAYVAHHPVRSADIGTLIDAVAERLAMLAAAETATTEEAAPAKPEPAVPVRRSVTPEHLVCLVCGQRVRTLKRHLSVAHGLTPAAYREAFGLKRDYPLVAPAYAARRAAIARQFGLGGSRRAPVAPPAPEPAPQPAPPRRRRRAKAGAKEAVPA